MFLQNKKLNFLFWVIVGIFIFLFIFLLYKLFPFYGAVFSFLWKLFAPFLISILIAYLLYPVVEKLHQLNIPKSIAILSIYLIFFGGGAYLIYRVYPLILIQLRDLNEHLPQLINMYQTIIYQIYESTSFLPETVHDKIEQVITKIETNLDELTGKLIGGITRIFDMIVLITVIPVLVFYFLKDFPKMKQYIKKYIPQRYKQPLSGVIHKVDESLGDYIRGQLLICFFVGLTTYIVFNLIGLKYALLLAIIMGLTNIIPYFGPIIGAVPAVLIALTMSGKLVIFVLITIFTIQLIESNLLAPYIVGKSVDIHPVVIIFVLLLGGQISGVLGMILAVPIVTIVKVILNHLLTIKI